MAGWQRQVGVEAEEAEREGAGMGGVVGGGGRSTAGFVGNVGGGLRGGGGEGRVTAAGGGGRRGEGKGRKWLREGEAEMREAEVGS